MSFKSSGQKTRPERVKPVPEPSLDSDSHFPPSWPTDTFPRPTRRRLSISSSSSAESFHSAHSKSHSTKDELPHLFPKQAVAANQHPSTPPNRPPTSTTESVIQPPPESQRFSPSTETSMTKSSNSFKTIANAQFSQADYSSALSTYDKAKAELPNYLDYELAVLQSNIAACHLKLEQWKEAIDACEEGLNGLENLMPTKKKKEEKKESVKDEDGRNDAKSGSKNNVKSSKPTPSSFSSSSTTTKPTSTSNKSTRAGKGQNATQDQDEADDDRVIELNSSSDEETTLAKLNLSDTRKSDIQRIRTKLLLRRARANTSITPSTWSTLSSAQSDYTLLSSAAYFNSLPPSDQKTVRKAMVELPAKVEEAKQRDVKEMMGKLKELGNGILRPFGLSTDMFKFTEGEGGGYSMNFDGKAG